MGPVNVAVAFCDSVIVAPSTSPAMVVPGVMPAGVIVSGTPDALAVAVCDSVRVEPLIAVMVVPARIRPLLASAATFIPTASPLVEATVMIVGLPGLIVPVVV